MAKRLPFREFSTVAAPPPLPPRALDGELLTRSIHAKTFEKRSTKPSPNDEARYDPDDGDAWFEKRSTKPSPNDRPFL
jgi:hypothetical protein